MTLVNLLPVTYIKYDHVLVRVQLRESIFSPLCLYTSWNKDGNNSKEQKALDWDSEIPDDSLIVFLNFSWSQVCLPFITRI